MILNKMTNNSGSDILKEILGHYPCYQIIIDYRRAVSMFTARKIENVMYVMVHYKCNANSQSYLEFEHFLFFFGTSIPQINKIWVQGGGEYAGRQVQKRYNGQNISIWIKHAAFFKTKICQNTCRLRIFTNWTWLDKCSIYLKLVQSRATTYLGLFGTWTGDPTAYSPSPYWLSHCRALLENAALNLCFIFASFLKLHHVSPNWTCGPL